VSLCGLPNPKSNSLDGEDMTVIIKKQKKHRGKPVVTTLGRGNHSIRSEQFRYIRFRNGKEELYDMQKDPWEWTNLASDPKYDSVKQHHQKHLPKTDAPDIEYFAYGHSKAEEQYGFHNISEMGKVKEELDNK
jgi:arylsulfatase A-like enzyme